MAWKGRSLLLACIAGFATAGSFRHHPAIAHPPAIVSGKAEQVMAEEIGDFRKRMAEAIAKKDAAALGAFYTDTFLHTDGDGTLQDKAARIAHVLTGVPVIETAPAEDLRIRVPNGWAAVATGRSALATPSTGKANQVRWSAFHVRVGEGWQLAGSQETRLP